MATVPPAGEQVPARPVGGLWLLFAVLLAPLAAVVLWGFLSAGLSWWSGALGAGLALLSLGAFARAFRLRGAARLLGAGAAVVLLPWLVRSVTVTGSERARLALLPAGNGPRWVDKLYPERDGTLLAAQLLGRFRPLPDVESERLPEILQRAFDRTDPSVDAVPTPAIATYLGLQSPSGFDTLVLAPPALRVAPDAAVVFLHGYAGSFYVYCWEVAQAAAAANLLTYCPAMDPSGAWWSADGERIFGAVLAHAREAGMNRIYLVGLSNGAAGASELALSHQRELSGLVLISGTRAAHPPAIPTLVIQGDRDRMMPAEAARAYAARAPGATYRELRGGHFVLLSRHEQVRPLLADFLLKLEQAAPGSPAFSGRPRPRPVAP